MVYRKSFLECVFMDACPHMKCSCSDGVNTANLGIRPADGVEDI